MKNNGKTVYLLAATILWAFPWAVSSAPIPFGEPQQVATIPWSDGSNQGALSSGPEWLLVGGHGRYYLGSGLDFEVYGPKGRHLKTLHPIDKSSNFFGFNSMEVLPNGSIALLTRLESPQEQWGKDNFEERSKPGARLLILGPEDEVRQDKEWIDPDQPHSAYELQNGTIYSVHDDGSFRTLGSLEGFSPKEGDFSAYAATTYSPDHWLEHLKSLPVFRSGDKSYHDIKGNLHLNKGAVSYLLGLLFVEGAGPLAERGGRIYYKVVLDKNQDFINAVFVEDPKKKEYGLVELLRADQELNASHGHTLFVDGKGDLFEGVAKKDGYRVYEWKISR